MEQFTVSEGNPKHGPIDVGEVAVPTSTTWGQGDPCQNQPPCATLSKFIGAGCQSELQELLLQSSWPLISNDYRTIKPHK